MTATPPEISKVKPPAPPGFRFLSIPLIFALLIIGFCVAFQVTHGFAQDDLLMWREQVLLPSGELIIVKRSEELHNGIIFRPMYWNRESIEIPNPDPKEPPIVWRSDVKQIKGTPRGARAIALYFENSSPKLIAYDMTGEYGCSFTHGLALFTWTKLTGWQYDPYTRIHTHYIGPSNLYSSYDGRRLHALVTKRDILIGPKSSDPLAFAQKIDVQHDSPNCSYPQPLSLADILNGPKE